MSNLHFRAAAGIFITQLLIGLPVAVAQEMEAASSPAADVTATASLTAETPSPVVNVHRLKVLLRPMMAEELQTEAEAWVGRLREQIELVGELELEIKASPKGTVDPTQTKKLVELRTQESALVERTQVVLDNLQAKGGDAEGLQKFLTAVSDIKKTTDATSYRAAILAEIRNWLQRADGGRLYAKRAVIALLILIVFWLISRFAGRSVARMLANHDRASQLLENFARRTVGGVVQVVGVLMALATLGIPVAPLAAALGGGSLILGFALQESLGNFASGLLIMVYRPFDLNDFVNVAGVEGVVQEMSLISTTLLTPDNKVLIIPNAKAWGDTIMNYTGKEVRRVDLVFGISYDDDIQQAIDALTETAKSHPLVLAEPAPAVQVDQLGDSSVNLLCRPWTKTSDYWTVHWDLTRQVKDRFDQDGISFPYPQQDIHVHPRLVTTADGG